MPWFRQPHRLLSRLLGLGTTVWLCRKVGCWARSFGRLGALVLRFVHRGRPQRRIPDYGHLLLDALYPGRRPTEQAASKARALAAESRTLEVPEEALALLGEAMLLSPPDASLYLARTEAHTRRRQLVEALDDAELCVSLDSTCVAGWLAKGEAERALGRSADAAFSFQAGLRAEPNHPELLARLAAVRSEPPPNLLRQLRDLVFAARLGLENLFRTVEDPEKTTDAYVEVNSSLLDAQIGLLAQTLRVNTTVLFDSPMLCDAYEQIVYACAQLIAGAPAACSMRLQNAPDIIEGLSLALRVGWNVHHSVPKLAANALAALAVCPNADDALRRQAVRHLLGGMLRWLLDARPEPDIEGEEVCGCSCTVPWKAAACFLERLFEPGRPQPWVREECEAWPDAAQLCQWLTLSVRDYHATPLGLVGLLQLPGVAAAVMRSEAIVDFFIPAPVVEDEDFDAATEAHSLQTGWPGSSQLSSASASTSGITQPRQAASVSHDVSMGAAMADASSSPAHTVDSPSVPHPQSAQGDEEPILPAPQRLGEWLIASVGYLLLFIEGDVLFTVCACRALQALAAGDAEDGTGRLLRGLWLGVPLLNKLSLFACSHTAALDLLHCLLRGPHSGVRVAARSLAHALARPLPSETAAVLLGSAPSVGEMNERSANKADVQERFSSDINSTIDPSSDEVSFEAAVAAAAAALAASSSSTMVPLVDEHLPEEDVVPSWAEFYQELLNELACPPDGKGEPPELVTLLNFEEKARFLAECAKVCVLIGDDAKAEGDDDGIDRRLLPTSSSSSSLDYVAVPSAWNRFTQPIAEGRQLLVFHGTQSDAEIGSEEYINDERKRGKLVLMSRSSIRQSSRVQNWAQAVTAAERAGAAAVLVFNNLDAMEPFRMGLFGEQSPKIPAFMVSGADGAALSVAASRACRVEMRRSIQEATSSLASDEDGLPLPPPWPLTGGRLPADVAQAWSLLEAMSSCEPRVQVELETLLSRMSVPEKRVWLTRRLVRHHRSHQAPDGGVEEPPLAFVEGDRSLTPAGQLSEIRRQMCEATGLGAEDICGEFEVRFKDEQGVGSAVLREWMDMIAREAYLHPGHRLLRSYDRRQSFLPDPAAPFCNPQWQMDYESLGRLLGLALWQNCTLDLPLHPHLLSLLCGFEEATSDDAKIAALKSVDEDLYRMKVQWLLEHPVDDLGCELPFSDTLRCDDACDEVAEATKDDAEQPCTLSPVVCLRDRCPGTVRSWPGKPLHIVGNAEVNLHEIDLAEQLGIYCEDEPSSGPQAPPTVTDENKASFVKALVDWRLHGCMRPQVEAMARGLRTVVPDSVLCDLRSLLSATEVSQLLCGLGEIDVENWESHCAYSQGLSRDADISKWFWRLVRDWSQSSEDCGKLPQLLQFVTGSARVPVGGFAELVGFNGAKHPFTLSRGVHLTTESLPMAHACICTLDLPSYEDENTCRAKLTQMLTLGRSHFDETAGHAED